MTSDDRHSGIGHAPSAHSPTILLDGYALSLEKGTGVATYARTLGGHVKALGYRTEFIYGTRSSAGDPKLLHEIAFHDPGDASGRGGLAARLRQIGRLAMLRAGTGERAHDLHLPGEVVTRGVQWRVPPHDRLWNATDLFATAQRYFRLFRRRLPVHVPGAPAIAHWTTPLPIEVVGAANIYTIHDLVPLRLPYTTTEDKREYLALMQHLADKADHIVTISESSKRDIVSLLGVDESRITNTYQAAGFPADLISRPEDEVADEVRKVLRLRYQGYFLFYAAIEPKKNLGRLLQAYLSSRARTPLVIVGSLAWKYEDEIRLLPAAGRRVIRFEYLPLDLLVAAIRGAKAVLFPSLYEGFGLPVLEAMMLGTPVLTSTASSLPEVAGDAALLVDPYDLRALSEAITALDTRENLRADLTARGLKRAEVFSTDAYRARLQALYESILRRRGP